MICSRSKILIFTSVITFLFPSVFAGENADWAVVSRQVNAAIGKYATPGGVVGYAIKDLKSGDGFARNGNIVFPSASIAKLPVMAEVYHQEATARLSMDERLVLQKRDKLPGCGDLQYLKNGSVFTVKRLLDLMITDSDNTATVMLMRRLGIDNINAYMKQIGLRNTMICDMTLINKTAGMCNTTSPDDMLVLLEYIYNGTLVSKQASREMLSIMTQQRHRWGISRFLPRSVVVANKTGSMDYVRNDVGIVLDKKNPYIIAIFSKSLPSNHRGTILVGSISKTVFEVKTGYRYSMLRAKQKRANV